VSAAGAQTFCSSDKSSEVGRQRTAELSNPSTAPTGIITGVGTTLQLPHIYSGSPLQKLQTRQRRSTLNQNDAKFSARQMTVIYHLVYGNYGGCSSLLSRIITICSVPINVRPKHDVSV